MSCKIFFVFGVFLGVFFGVFLQILKKMKRESIITLPQIVHVSGNKKIFPPHLLYINPIGYGFKNFISIRF